MNSKVEEYILQLKGNMDSTIPESPESVRKLLAAEKGVRAHVCWRGREGIMVCFLMLQIQELRELQDQLSQAFKQAVGRFEENVAVSWCLCELLCIFMICVCLCVQELTFNVSALKLHVDRYDLYCSGSNS